MLNRLAEISSYSVPDGCNLPPVNALSLTASGAKISGSTIGSPHEMAEMLQFAADKGIMPWIIERPISDANEVLVNMVAGQARYRYVLVNQKHL